MGDYTAHLISELKEIIFTYKLNLNDIFKNFDKDKKGTLDQKELSQLLRVIAPGLKEEDVIAVFKKFDMDGDGEISFNEFERVLVYGSNISQSQSTQEVKAKKILD